MKELMSDEEKLLEMSINCKNFSCKFNIDTIIDDWINLFDEIDKDN